MKISTKELVDLAMSASSGIGRGYGIGDNFRIAQRDNGEIYGGYTDLRSDYADRTIANIPVDSWTDFVTMRNNIIRAIDRQ